MNDNIKHVTIVLDNGIAYDIPGTYVTAFSLSTYADTATSCQSVYDQNEIVMPPKTWVELEISLVAPTTVVYATSESDSEPTKELPAQRLRLMDSK